MKNIKIFKRKPKFIIQIEADTEIIEVNNFTSFLQKVREKVKEADLIVNYYFINPEKSCNRLCSKFNQETKQEILTEICQGLKNSLKKLDI